MIFMVLSSWQSHCESSPGSFDECRLCNYINSICNGLAVWRPSVCLSVCPVDILTMTHQEAAHISARL